MARRSRSMLSLLSLLAFYGLAACGGEPGRNAAQPVSAASIGSADYALLPCAPSSLDAPCLLVVAGGKHLLFGTPAGLRAAIDAETLGSLDAVLLFSLQGPNLEGLDEVRNAGWTGGREEPLAVSGPAGTRDVVAALNKAFELSDAQVFVETPPRGGFGAALLGVVPGEGDAKARVFDTGDLIVTKIETADGRAGYWVDYGGQRAVLQPCGMDNAIRFNDREAVILACEGEGASPWPLKTLQYLVRGEKAEP